MHFKEEKFGHLSKYFLKLIINFIVDLFIMIVNSIEKLYFIVLTLVIYFKKLIIAV